MEAKRSSWIRYTQQKTKVITLTALLLAPLANLHAAEPPVVPVETKEQNDQRMKWFREARQ